MSGNIDADCCMSKHQLDNGTDAACAERFLFSNLPKAKCMAFGACAPSTAHWALQVRHKFRSVSQAVDLLGALSTREYSHTAYYSGPFTIGDMMTIKVKVSFRCLHNTGR